MARILLIDDSEFARMVLREMLQSKGYEICGEADNGLDGIEDYKRLKPDLTICDIRMNGMSGLDCIKEILAEDAGAKVLVCAADNPKDKMEDVLKLGIKGIVNKPVNIKELTKAVEKALTEQAEGVNYKELTEERAAAEGVGLNSLLDFFAAFRSINGFALDSPKADRQFLQNNGGEMLVGIRALLSAKVPLAQINKMEEIFNALIS